MKRITMGGEALITDDRVADLVLEYANLLAQSGTPSTVTIPVIAESGGVRDAQLLIGPASQLVVTEDGEDGPDIPVDEVLGELRSRIERYRPPAPDEPVDPDPATYFVRFDDYGS